MFLASLWGAIMEVFYFIGALVGIWCVYDLFAHKNLEIIWKIVIAILILVTSWVGLAVYLLFVRGRIPNK